MRPLRSPELVEASGATYRQVDWWARRGLLPVVTPAHGSGTPRLFHPDAVRVATALRRWAEIDYGDIAEAVQRAEPGTAVHLGNGIVIFPEFFEAEQRADAVSA